MIDVRCEADAARFAGLDDQECQLCLAYGEDKRSLNVGCFYDVKEVVPEMIDTFSIPGKDGWMSDYYLRICKSCRAAFLGMMADWRNDMICRRNVPKDHDGNDADGGEGIPYRKNGTTVWLTVEEWKKEKGL